MKKNRWGSSVALYALFTAFTHQIHAATGTLEETIRQAVVDNPEVKAAWYTFNSAREHQRVAKGGYYPRVDLVAEAGHEDVESPITAPDSYSRDSSRLTLTQMLFDGFETANTVKRLDYTRRARFYEFKLASEQAALEATRAYLDVQRFQELVRLAEKNYVEHRAVYDQIQERVSAGVSRSVDLEQAHARLALAETNLLTEMTNLHDVTARFQRIVGELPAKNLQPVALPDSSIPANRTLVLDRAYENNPALNAALESIRSAQAELKSKNAPMMPRLDLRLRKELDHDTDGIDGRFETDAAELVLTYNLYNGGSDSATKRQYYELLNVARENRIKTCRDVRQTAMVAFNDIQTLKEQLTYLERNLLSISKARLAYQKQFDIGQRTLLDLLDTENEYFESQRALINAQQDLILAQARTLAGMGVYLPTLNIAGIQSETPVNLGTQGEQDTSTLCPPEPTAQPDIDKDALFAELLRNDKRFRQTSPDKLTYSMTVEFAFNSSIIQDNFTKDIYDGAKLLKQHPEIHGVVEGHTDSTGTDEYNLWLSQRRADAVMNALIEKHEVPAEQLKAKGYGEQRPIADNGTDEGRSRNRRVEMVIEYIENPAAGDAMATPSNEMPE